MRFIRPTISREDAVARMGKKKLLRKLFALARRLILGPPPQPPSTLEIVWLPYVVVRFRLSETFVAGISVEGISGTSNRFDESAFEFAEDENGEVLPVLLVEEEIEKAARDSLQRLLMARAHTNPIPKQVTVEEKETVPYPYWVRIFRNRRGKLDMNVLDAVTGKRPGGKTKVSILDGFIDQDRKRRQANPRP